MIDEKTVRVPRGFVFFTNPLDAAKILLKANNVIQIEEVTAFNRDGGKSSLDRSSSIQGSKPFTSLLEYANTSVAFQDGDVSSEIFVREDFVTVASILSDAIALGR